MNYGASFATGQILYFIHADARPLVVLSTIFRAPYAKVINRAAIVSDLIQTKHYSNSTII